MRRIIFLLALVLSLAMPSSSSGNEFEFLSGRWVGKQSWFQRGSCSMDRSAVRASGTRWVLTTNADGSFSAEVSFGGRQSAAETWTGTMDPSLNITLLAPRKALCRDQWRDYSIAYTGKVVQKKGTYRIEITGTDAPCPEFKCTFENRVQITRK